jgi:hypothetical protein
MGVVAAWKAPVALTWGRLALAAAYSLDTLADHS